MWRVRCIDIYIGIHDQCFKLKLYAGVANLVLIYPDILVIKCCYRYPSYSVMHVARNIVGCKLPLPRKIARTFFYYLFFPSSLNLSTGALWGASAQAKKKKKNAMDSCPWNWIKVFIGTYRPWPLFHKKWLYKALDLFFLSRATLSPPRPKPTKAVS